MTETGGTVDAETARGVRSQPRWRYGRKEILVVRAEDDISGNLGSGRRDKRACQRGETAGVGRGAVPGTGGGGECEDETLLRILRIPRVPRVTPLYTPTPRTAHVTAGTVCAKIAARDVSPLSAGGRRIGAGGSGNNLAARRDCSGVNGGFSIYRDGSSDRAPRAVSAPRPAKEHPVPRREKCGSGERFVVRLMVDGSRWAVGSNLRLTKKMNRPAEHSSHIRPTCLAHLCSPLVAAN